MNELLLTLELINEKLMTLLSNCKCDSVNSSNIKEEVNVLFDKYQQMKQIKVIENKSDLSITTVRQMKVQSKRDSNNRIKLSTHANTTVGANKLVVKQESKNENHNNDEHNWHNVDDTSNGLVCDAVVVASKAYVCEWPQCDERFHKKSLLVKHRFCHSDRKPFACDWPGCHFQTTSMHHVRNHRNCHTGERPFKCLWPGCDKSYLTSVLLNRHMKRFHSSNAPKFVCDWPGCEYTSHDSFVIKLHKGFHRGERHYKCDWPGCEKRFPTKSSLNQHNDIHSGFKRYACDWPGCDFKTAYIFERQRHKRTHTGEKPYKCSWPSCESCFAEAHHLKSHMLKHTGERPFTCEWSGGCDRKFQSRQAMRFHMERAHKT